jgi:hypothetical protein
MSDFKLSSRKASESSGLTNNDFINKRKYLPGTGYEGPEGSGSIALLFL